MFKPASREQNRLRLAIEGPPGSGKTYTALRFAFALGKRVAVIDTEHASASKYEGDSPDGIPWKFDVVNLEYFAPSSYEQAILEAGKQGYEVLVIDSLSHAWVGIGGALDQVDKAAEKVPAGKFGAWRDVTPQHNAMIDAIIRSPCHLIATMRAKMEYVVEQNEKGKWEPRKIGLKPIQREGAEYEFDIFADMDQSHTLKVSKSRCSAVDGKVVNKPDAGFIQPVKEWLFTGKAPSASSTNGTGGAAAGIQLSTIVHCDHVLATEIKELWRSLDRTPEALREVLAKRNAARLTDLPLADAQGLASRLRELVLKKEGNETF